MQEKDVEKSKTWIRLEWISIVYLALFVLAVLSPSLVARDLFGIQERHVEEILIFLFGITGLATFSIYQRYMEKSEKEHQDARNEYDRAKRELVESYKYIGSLNRQIDVLKGLANKTSVELVKSDYLSKDLLTSLISSAAASAGAQTALIRYVDLKTLRTHNEVFHTLEKAEVMRVSNKVLRRIHEEGVSHSFLQDEKGSEILVIPSDQHSKCIKAYILIAYDRNKGASIDISLLKVFANQAELLHHALDKQSNETTDPIELVEQTEKQVSGEVS
ncbi:MAG: hypothetical protein ABII13_05060 [Patescibacteria group bacterium]|nr:hypothetical protein [Patescibacteria group bacterium]MBU2508866.1 hypothetical protein [Patescibacteria group bacterium]